MNRPTNGSTYFYVTNDGSIGQSTWKYSTKDNLRLQENNAFTNRDDAHKKQQQSQRSGSAA